VSFATIILCVPSQRVLNVVYFVIDSVRRLLDTPSYLPCYVAGEDLGGPTIKLFSTLPTHWCSMGTDDVRDVLQQVPWLPRRLHRDLESLICTFYNKNFVHFFYLSYACYMTHPSHPPWLYYYNNIWWSVQVMKLLIS